MSTVNGFACADGGKRGRGHRVSSIDATAWGDAGAFEPAGQQRRTRAGSPSGACMRGRRNAHSLGHRAVVVGAFAHHLVSGALFGGRVRQAALPNLAPTLRARRGYTGRKTVRLRSHPRPRRRVEQLGDTPFRLADLLLPTRGWGPIGGVREVCGMLEARSGAAVSQRIFFLFFSK